MKRYKNLSDPDKDGVKSTLLMVLWFSIIIATTGITVATEGDSPATVAFILVTISGLLYALPAIEFYTIFFVDDDESS